MHSDRNSQLRSTARSRVHHCTGLVHCAVWSLALAACSFDPAATGNPQSLEDYDTEVERMHDAGVDRDAGDASQPAKRASVGHGRRGESSPDVASDAAARPDERGDRPQASSPERAAEAAPNAADNSAHERDDDERATSATSPDALGGAAVSSRGGDEDAGEDATAGEAGVFDASLPADGAPAPDGQAIDAIDAIDASADGAPMPDAGDAAVPETDLDASRSRPDTGASDAAPMSEMPETVDPPSEADRRFALDLLAVVVSTLQAHPNEDSGDLLETLAGDVTPDPALIADVLEFVDDAEDCSGWLAPCARACAVVAERCRECTRDSECEDALNDACGRNATRCW